MIDNRNSSTPAGQILEFLLRSGSASIKDLEGALGVTATAVRQQLASLTAEGLVAVTQERSGVGRPRNLYKPTGQAYGMVTRHTDDLALSLIGELLEIEGADKLRFLLNRISSKLASRFGNHVQAEAVGDRVRELSALLDRRGIMSDFRQDADVIILSEYNCPYHELASVHRDVCEMERDAFSQVLGADVTLSNCIQDGHHSCQFRVSSESNGDSGRLAAA